MVHGTVVHTQEGRFIHYSFFRGDDSLMTILRSSTNQITLFRNIDDFMTMIDRLFMSNVHQQRRMKHRWWWWCVGYKKIQDIHSSDVFLYSVTFASENNIELVECAVHSNLTYKIQVNLGQPSAPS